MDKDNVLMALMMGDAHLVDLRWETKQDLNDITVFGGPVKYARGMMMWEIQLTFAVHDAAVMNNVMEAAT